MERLKRFGSTHEVQALKSKLYGSSAASKAKRSSDCVPRTGADGENFSKLEHHISVAEGLAKFARDFVLSLDCTLKMVNSFIETVRAVDSDWLQGGAHAESGAYVWAMAMGITATVPAVSKELQRHLKTLEATVAGSRTAQKALSRKAKAQQERNHYMLKLQTLHDEMHERRAAGRGSSVEQQQRLVRNEEKLAQAQRELDSYADAASDVVERQIERGKSALIAELHGISQVVACGFFASTGAVVCKSLHRAGEAQRSEEAADQPDDGVVVLPASVSKGARLEPSGKFDPSNPLGGGEQPSAVALPEPSGLLLLQDDGLPEVWYPDEGETSPSAAGRQCAAPSPTAVPEAEGGVEVPLEDLPVQRLKHLLRANGLSDEGCLEKKDLVARLRSRTASGSASPAGAGKQSPNGHPPAKVFAGHARQVAPQEPSALVPPPPAACTAAKEPPSPAGPWQEPASFAPGSSAAPVPRPADPWQGADASGSGFWPDASSSGTWPSQPAGAAWPQTAWPAGASSPWPPASPDSPAVTGPWPDTPGADIIPKRDNVDLLGLFEEQPLGGASPTHLGAPSPQSGGQGAPQAASSFAPP